MGTWSSHGCAAACPKRSDLNDVEFSEVRKRYRVYHERYRSLKEVLIHRSFGVWEDRWALNGVSFGIPAGSTFGLIGPNGAGKSTSLKLMSRILEPDGGSIRVARKLAGLLELGSGFQAEYTGRENVYFNASLLGLTRAQIDARFPAIVEFSELEEYIDSPLRTYSSGMQMRLGFATAIHVDAEILLVDEVLAVGDEAFQRKCFAWFESFRARGGTVVFVSHSLGVVESLCDTVAWIEGGKLRELGSPREVVAAYLRSATHGEVVEAAPVGASHQAARLGEIRVLAQGRPVHEVAVGDSVEVEIGYLAPGRLEAPSFGIRIATPDLITIHCFDSVADGVDLGPLEGSGTVRVEFPKLPLLPGGYVLEVTLGAGSRSGAEVLDRRRIDDFVVVRPASTGMRDEGLVRVPHVWSRGEPAKGGGS